MLANHFLHVHCTRFGLPALCFSSDAMVQLKRQPWRGNIRELSHTIESVILRVQGNVIEVEDLALRRVESQAVGGAGMRVETGNGRVIYMDFETGTPTLDEVEHAILTAAFDYTDQNLSRAARILGITREALRYRLNKSSEKVET
jgi:DNA-binding NtrC family response regulator